MHAYSDRLIGFQPELMNAQWVARGNSNISRLCWVRIVASFVAVDLLVCLLVVVRGSKCCKSVNLTDLWGN